MPPGPPIASLAALAGAAATAALPDRPIAWFDAHTHIGQNDPDGKTATAAEILAGLDAAGHQRALTFAMHEPDGYRAANDVVLEASAASGGRLVPLARIAPGAADARREALRCLDAGAQGFKLHPRSDDFTLTHPDVEYVVALAAERRRPVLFHAGRGIPQLGESALRLAARYPDARLILAHAAVSDLGLLAESAPAHPNLYFDTSWWHPADLLQLFATIPPGQILYASDMPYGPGLFAMFATLRCAAAVGLSPEVVAGIVGEQLERVVSGRDPLELGAAPGSEALGPRALSGERVVSYTAIAMQLAYREQDPSEAIALARCGCQTTDTGVLGDVLAQADDLLAGSQQRLARGEALGIETIAQTLMAGFLAATPRAGVLVL